MSFKARSLLVVIGLAAPMTACAQPPGTAKAAPPPTLVSSPPRDAIVVSGPEPVPGVIRPDALPRKRRVLADMTDIARLRERMHADIGSVLVSEAPKGTGAAMLAARQMLERTKTPIDGPQIVLVVDRAPAVQRLWISVVGAGDVITPLGTVRVSTGKPGRKEHFRTPVGVFDNDASILGYRAQGTYNENHIRGIGVKGMRVWDFGWQTTDDWRFKDTTGTMAVRMEMHATDPSALEPRLGRWDSEGCIRIPSKFNTWLDNSGLIDLKLQEAAVDDRRFRALLPKDVKPNPLAGHLLVVVDTSDPDAPLSDPLRAAALQHPANATPEHDDAG